MFHTLQYICLRYRVNECVCACVLIELMMVIWCVCLLSTLAIGATNWWRSFAKSIVRIWDCAQITGSCLMVLRHFIVINTFFSLGIVRVWLAWFQFVTCVAEKCVCMYDTLCLYLYSYPHFSKRPCSCSAYIKI